MWDLESSRTLLYFRALDAGRTSEAQLQRVLYDIRMSRGPDYDDAGTRLRLGEALNYLYTFIGAMPRCLTFTNLRLYT